MTNHVILFVLMCVVSVLSQTMPCPSDQCRCEKGTRARGRIINCRARGLAQIPRFEPTDEMFYELTLANPVGCSECNNITVIPPGAFAGLKFQILDLSGNKISYVSSEAFSRLVPMLTEISIEGDGRYPPPYQELSVLTNLQTLTLKNFSQLYMNRENTDLQNLLNLEELNIKNMEISHISENVFQNRLPKLKRLQLAFLPLVTLPVSSLRHLRKLEVFRAISIDITDIPYRAFSSFQNLKELDLSHNEIRVMTPGCFDGIDDSLEYLGLHLNKLNEKNVGPLAAAGWKNLRQLNLGHNKMTSMPVGLFFNMNALEYLNLDSNQIALVQTSTFQGLQSLDYMDLSYNKLSSLSAGAFLHTPKLTQLDIRGEDTPVFNLSRQGIQGLENTLEDLILTDTVVYEQDMWRAVSSLSRLQDLKLGGTKVTAIPDYQFINNRNLVTLMLDRNGITDLSQKTFHGLDRTLKTLNLQGNVIKSINKCVLTSLTNVEMLYLGKNPLNCDCNLLALKNWITTRISKNFIFQYMVDAMCRAPSALNGREVWELDNAQLTCGPDRAITTCETLPDVITTTEIPTSRSTHVTETDENALFRFTRLVETQNTVELDWSFMDDRIVSGSKLEYQLLGQTSENMVIDLSPSLKNYVISGLRPDSNYLLCLSVVPRSTRLPSIRPRKVCVAVKTLT
ncbi:leucine-rich repeat-containing protein 70-like [Mizuhopecten yessoensis]|uniref:leucine-rich repeat-containing protein 70-like n=1 Tax=Mizuhopecten yessoensis TaxID=6573 RepID=UPI000B45A5DA|nr:leucine-rich repeat-containing protein 70-like [Mizuhopecten yessoensis]